jgi:hypothetical protein
MRKIFWPAALLALVVVWPSRADAQTANSQVQGFGGFTFGESSFLGNNVSSTFGGGVAVGLGPNMQAIGEFGRLNNIAPGLYSALSDFTPYDLRVSAWYGEGGVRFIASSPHSAVRPYGEATAGFARLSTTVAGLSGETGEYVDVVLGLLNRTEPALGVGGGVLVQGGPLVVDVGYRYKKILTGDAIGSVLTLGSDSFHVNEVRFGFGVRF